MLKRLMGDCRAGDTWMPLFQVAATYPDKSWIQYATGELKKAMDNLSVGQEFEASQLVVSTLVSLAITPDLKQLRPRVALHILGFFARFRACHVHLHSAQVCFVIFTILSPPWPW
jgi:hypothetical protein